MIQLFNATTLQQMNERKKEKKDKKMISVGEKSAKNVKIKEIIEKKILKKKENSDTIMFGVVDVKNLNTMIFMKYHIDDTTTMSNNFTKFSFEFENLLKKENAAQTRKKKEKKRYSKKNESFEKTKKKKTNE